MKGEREERNENIGENPHLPNATEEKANVRNDTVCGMPAAGRCNHSQGLIPRIQKTFCEL